MYFPQLPRVPRPWRQRRPWVRLAEREVIEIPSGSAPLKYSHLKNTILRGTPTGGGNGNGNGETPPAPSGERAIRDGKGSDEDGLRLDFCENVTVQDLEFTGFYRGLRIADSEGIDLVNVTVHDCEQQGVLTVNLRRFTAQGLTVRAIAGQHAVYWSEDAEDMLLEDCDLRDAADCGLQINSEGGSHPARNCRVVNSVIENDHCINLLGGELRVDGCTLAGRINLDTCYGEDWPSTLTFGAGTTHEGNLNISGGSHVIDERE